MIGIGDYAPQGGGITTGMRRAMNNRSLLGRFKEVVSWVAERSGKIYTEYEEKGTTRTCHIPEYGYVVEGGLSPDKREWICPKCGTFHNRDELDFGQLGSKAERINKVLKNRAWYF
jgi:putative transposase